MMGILGMVIVALIVCVAIFTLTYVAHHQDGCNGCHGDCANCTGHGVPKETDEKESADS